MGARDANQKRSGIGCRSRSDVCKASQGPHVLICEGCIAVCRQLLDEQTPFIGSPRACKPKELKALLDEWVVRQDHAKRILSVAVYNHLKRIALPREVRGTEITKSN